MPTALIDPDDRHLIVFERNRAMWACALADFEIWVLTTIFSSGGSFLGTPDPSIGDSTPLVRLGQASIDGFTPSSGYLPTATDEHILVDDLGYFQMFFANRYTDTIDSGTGQFERDLELLSRARSSRAYDPDELDYFLAVLSNVAPGAGIWLVVYRLVQDLLTFDMGSCDPLCMSEVLYGSCGTNDAGVDLINDPDVYIGGRSALYGQFRCGPLGGLVYARAGEVPGFGYTCNDYCDELTATSTSPFADAICELSCNYSLWLYGYERL